MTNTNKTSQTTVDATALPYRRCVGVMLLNQQGLIWIGQRIPKPHDPTRGRWQMPQGGIDAGEEPIAAARRELHEETGVHSIEMLAESAHWYTYDLPPELIGKALKGRYRGQTQRWFACRFTGDEAEIDLSEKPEEKPEFEDWRWAEPCDLMDLVVPFKRGVYEQVLAEFSHLTA